MKNLRNKLLAGIFTFTIGVSAFYLVSRLKPEIFDVFYKKCTIEETALPEIKEVELSEIKEVKFSDKVEVRFVGFSGNEDADYQLAKFEVTNNTSQNAYYISYSKNDYPFPELKRNGSIAETNIFHCGTGLKEQTLKPGETVKFSVPKSEIVNEYKDDQMRETNEPTQIGFPIQLGENGFVESRNKRETYFWSEEIKFPN